MHQAPTENAMTNIQVAGLTSSLARYECCESFIFPRRNNCPVRALTYFAASLSFCEQEKNQTNCDTL